MTPLRQRMIEDMEVRNLSPCTIDRYVQQVVLFARHFNRSPALLGLDEIRDYQLHLVHERKLSWSSFNQAVCAIRFLYLKTLGKDWNIESIPFAKQPKKLPLVLSQDEVHAVLDAITNPQNRVIAITLYAAGLRISEAVSLRIADIDSQRMLLHVVQGKGRKDRLVTLSPVLLHHLRCHYQRYRPRSWLFPSRQYPDRHVTRDAVALAIAAVRHVVTGKPVTAHTMRHCFATHLLESGTDLRTVQALLGHAAINSTVIYTYVTRKHITAVQRFRARWNRCHRCAERPCTSRRSRWPTSSVPWLPPMVACRACGCRRPNSASWATSQPAAPPSPAAHVDACDACGEVRVSYNSCRNRHCPKCQAHQRATWLEDRCQDLLPVPYFHVVFTLPAELELDGLYIVRSNVEPELFDADQTVRAYKDLSKVEGAPDLPPAR